MQLNTYLPQESTARKRTLDDLAKRANTSSAYLYMITLGHKRCGHKLARSIEAATDGAVSKYDLRPDIFGPAPEATPAKRKVRRAP